MSEHYFSEKPKSKLKTKEINIKLRDENINLILASGTFSSKRMDKGSRILAEYIRIKDNDEVLDLGCGNGIIGIIASKLTNNDVILIDINQRAVEIAKRNAESMKNITVLQGDLYEPVDNRKFDVILINLPTQAGKDVCSRMILGAKGHLKQSGSLQIVEKHNYGGKYFEDLMKKTLGNIEILARKGGYWVCSSTL